MITIKQSGNFKNTERFFNNAKNLKIQSLLAGFGSAGVTLLANATPSETGATARSWDYRIVQTAWGWSIEWFNTNENKGSVVALLIQYGHGTGTGGYVPPNDFINPAMRPAFEKMAEDAWKEVTSL